MSQGHGGGGCGSGCSGAGAGDRTAGPEAGAAKTFTSHNVSTAP